MKAHPLREGWALSVGAGVRFGPELIADGRRIN